MVLPSKIKRICTILLMKKKYRINRVWVDHSRVNWKDYVKAKKFNLMKLIDCCSYIF